MTGTRPPLSGTSKAHQFDRHTSRAVSQMEQAKEQIQAAKDAVDNS